MSIPTVNGVRITINWIADNPHHAYKIIKALSAQIKEVTGAIATYSRMKGEGDK